MRKRLVRTLIWALITVPYCVAVWGQSGTVKSGGQPIPGATVRATQGERVLTTLTDVNGTFKLDKMTPGAWNVDVIMFGFEPVRREVQIGANPTKIDIALQLGTIRAFGLGRGGQAVGQGNAPGDNQTARAGGGRGGAGGQQGGFGQRGAGGGFARDGSGAGGSGRGGFGRGGVGQAGAAGGVASAGGPGAAASGPPARATAPTDANANAAIDNGGIPGAPNQEDANQATVNQADTQAAFNGGVNGNNGFAQQPEASLDAAGGGPIPQADASGANESFLVNGSLSAGLNTNAGDFGPPFGRGGGGLNAGGATAANGGGAPGVEGAAAQQAGPGGFGVGGFGGGGGRGGGGGGFAGPGRGGRAPGGRGGNGAFIGNRRNAGRPQIRGSIFYAARNSAVDAAPYSLNGQTGTKAAYAQNRFGFNLGGSLPKSPNTFFFVNYTGNLLRNGVNLTGTVPTLAERGGDFSALSSVVYDPSTGQPFSGNQIPGYRINSIAQDLLDYIPKPNQPGTVNNYRFTTANPNNNQALNTRIMQTLSRKDQLGVGVNWQTRNSDNAQLFGFTDTSSGNGINANINWRHNFGNGKFNNLTATFNRNTSTATPFFAFGADVATQLGIAGTSSDPINFGPPNLSFTNYSGLSDGSPSSSAISAAGINDTFAFRRGDHNWNFGAGFMRNFNNTLTDANGRGTFAFTGLITSQFTASGQAVNGTGLDLADFLIGFPQSNSIRYGASATYFRTNSWFAFGQDDWRMRPNLTFNLGLRYEFFAPWQEKYGRIANLDIAPGFTAVSVVTPGLTGPYSGVNAAGLIQPDRNNFAPRTALAWKPWTKRSMVVRLGYGWYYNPGVYNQFIGRLSAQPPFAQSTTVNSSLTNPLTLANGLTVTPDGKNILNTYAVDQRYRDMYAQSWSAGIQTNIPAAMVLEVNYLGTKGTRLDVQVNPNQAPPGSPLTSEQRTLIGNATGFTYDTPVGNSIYHAGQVRLNRRFRSGFSGNLQYTFAKSIDDSSTLGGAGNTIAQNFYNLSAERGLSSFDRRHNLSSTFILTSPVGGPKGLLANRGALTSTLTGWTVTGNITYQTGTPLTARVLGNQSDTAGTGNFGSGRASATGLPVDSGSGFFNLAAFTVPAPGQYGNAGRNTIPGPNTFSMNASLQRTMAISERVRLQVRMDANNVLNHGNITNFGTVVNSINYGVPTSAAGMRSLTLTLRFNF